MREEEDDCADVASENASVVDQRVPSCQHPRVSDDSEREGQAEYGSIHEAHMQLAHEDRLDGRQLKSEEGADDTSTEDALDQLAPLAQENLMLRYLSHMVVLVYQL